ncbi:hypothetical protein WR25_06469 [Diploscapter pachys]|uniref:WD repeat-containing protein 79 n=1 Tax=Diploscapter pachys TaxID=2018661 RepID=A0A2A2LF79_9BILA|nr:hypothetical protein WR25_06469 [Diploscapter pachys]
MESNETGETTEQSEVTVTNEETLQVADSEKNEKGEEQQDNEQTKQEDVDESVAARREHKMYRGLGAYLQLLRDSNEAEKGENSEGTNTEAESNEEKKTEDTEQTGNEAPAAAAAAESKEGRTEEIDPEKLKGLSRKERRALMFKNRKPEPEPEQVEEIPVKIQRFEVAYDLENAPQTSTFCDKATFSSSKKASFGFGQTNFLNNYVKSARFSPCGQFVATTSQDHNARVFKLDVEENKLSLLSSIACGDLIYDSCFHPCGDLLATTTRLHPIHLWDAQGQLMASYRGINHLDELSAAQTMCFSLDGSRVYAGYKRMIRVWDVRRPGPQIIDIPTWSKEYGGQRAIISSIAMHPLFDGQYAAACYGPSIAFYSDRTNTVDCIFTGDFKATTHLQFSSDGMKLFSASRKSSEICCWDVRNPSKLLAKLVRPMDLNHKATFDIDSSCRFLFSGTSDGQIVAFDLNDNKEIKLPIWTRRVADCCVPSVSLSPSLPLLTACTGERVFPYPKITKEDNQLILSDSDDSSDESTSQKYRGINRFDDLLNSVQLWKLAL